MDKHFSSMDELLDNLKKTGEKASKIYYRALTNNRGQSWIRNERTVDDAFLRVSRKQPAPHTDYPNWTRHNRVFEDYNQNESDNASRTPKRPDGSHGSILKVALAQEPHKTCNINFTMTKIQEHMNMISHECECFFASCPRSHMSSADRRHLKIFHKGVLPQMDNQRRKKHISNDDTSPDSDDNYSSSSSADESDLSKNVQEKATSWNRDHFKSNCEVLKPKFGSQTGVREPSFTAYSGHHEEMCLTESQKDIYSSKNTFSPHASGDIHSVRFVSDSHLPHWKSSLSADGENPPLIQSQKHSSSLQQCSDSDMCPVHLDSTTFHPNVNKTQTSQDSHYSQLIENSRSMKFTKKGTTRKCSSSLQQCPDSNMCSVRLDNTTFHLDMNKTQSTLDNHASQLIETSHSTKLAKKSNAKAFKNGKEILPTTSSGTTQPRTDSCLTKNRVRRHVSPAIERSNIFQGKGKVTPSEPNIDDQVLQTWKSSTEPTKDTNMIRLSNSSTIRGHNALGEKRNASFKPHEDGHEIEPEDMLHFDSFQPESELEEEKCSTSEFHNEHDFLNSRLSRHSLKPWLNYHTLQYGFTCDFPNSCHIYNVPQSCDTDFCSLHESVASDPEHEMSPEHKMSPEPSRKSSLPDLIEPLGQSALSEPHDQSTVSEPPESPDLKDSLPNTEKPVESCHVTESDLICDLESLTSCIPQFTDRWVCANKAKCDEKFCNTRESKHDYQSNDMRFDVHGDYKDNGQNEELNNGRKDFGSFSGRQSWVWEAMKNSITWEGHNSAEKAMLD